MLFQIVHTIGSTTYFLFFVLFLCASLVPRANPGAGWWALAILCALVSRLSYFILHPGQDAAMTLAVYSSINILEKLFLAIGVIKFLKCETYLRWIGLAAITAELLILLIHAFNAATWMYSAALTVYNASVLFAVGVFTWKYRKQVPHQLMAISAVICFLLVLHWISTFFLIRSISGWDVIAFSIGTLLVFALYLSLLSGILMQLYARLVAAEAKALDLAYQDPLTGLNNMRYVDTLFDKALMLATRPHQFLAVIYIDLDNFKPINDTAGHSAGDKTLKLIAKKLKDNTRSTDICARVGGDEFVVVATQIENEEHVHLIAKKLLSVLTEEIQIEGKTYTLGASIGISLYPKDGSNLEQLIKNADAAMYEIKHHGKSSYRIFNEPTS